MLLLKLGVKWKVFSISNFICTYCETNARVIQETTELLKSTIFSAYFLSHVSVYLEVTNFYILPCGT